MWHPDMPFAYRNQIVTGDCKELAKAIPDESIGLIFTDPPYPKEYLLSYDWLAETAARVLRPGGLCLALCGHFFVGAIWQMMEQYLEPFWIGGMGHNEGNAAIFPRKMWASWKPLLWFKKPGNTVKEWTFDFFTPSKRDKKFHHWGQPEDHSIYYISRLSIIGDVILDPFVGGGTIPAVCKTLQRNFVAFEIDPDVAEKARQRVANTQVPMFQVPPAELKMWP